MHGSQQILFVQGGGENVHDDWDNLLVDSLRRELGREYEILYPRMPHEEDPKYASWKKVLDKELSSLQRGAVLVGHSVGATILLNVLAHDSRPRDIGAIISIAAPFIGDGGWSTDDEPFPPELGERLPKDAPIHFFQGLEDEVVPPSHVDLYARAIPRARIHRLQGLDHQFKNDLKKVAGVISSLERAHR